jgi:MoaA/NifB/PqqE/SkfB family radical SAM enzyme
MKKTVDFSKNARNLFFHILTRCNLRCKHCYINPKQHGENRLPLRTIEAWLDALFVEHKETHVIFLGGEPTLHPDLALAIKKAKDIGYSSITVDTNGYLFNNILFKVGPDEVDYFSFSLDGASRETNDKIRGRGSYDTCIAGIRQAVDRGFATSLIYTVSKFNIHELEMMVPLLKELRIDRFFIQVIGIRGRPAKNAKTKEKDSPDCEFGLQVSPSDWLEIIPRVAQEAAHHGITSIYPKVFLDSQEPFVCAGLVAENFFIFPNGRVYRCPLGEDFPIHSLEMKDNQLIAAGRINEGDLFPLNIPEGCVLNKIIQPENIIYKRDGTPENRIACCMLKEEVRGQ